MEPSNDVGDNGQNKPKKRTMPALKSEFLAEFARCRFNISKTSREIGVHRNSVYAWAKKDARFADQFHHAQEEMKDYIGEALIRLVDKDDTTAVIFACKTLLKDRGFVEGDKVHVKTEAKQLVTNVFDALLSGDLDVREAAFKIEQAGEPLPESLKILLSKQAPEEPESETAPLWSEEELEAKYQATLKKVALEKSEWVPERQSEVSKIKKELADQDSFSDENLENERDKK